MNTDPISEITAILACYDIGELLDWERNERGYVNISYAIETSLGGERCRFFLRKYKRGIKRPELEFEHSLIDHLVQSEFERVARVLPTRDGQSFVQRFESEHDRDGVFYAIFDFLPGDDRYTWINPICNDREIESAAVALAQFHSAVYGFIPQGKRQEPGILDHLSTVSNNLMRCAEREGESVFDSYLKENLCAIMKHIKRTRHALELIDPKSLIHLVIHCDYHPGNLRFQRDAIVGLLDFDWSKIDARCFDVALAVLYFCATWPGKERGGFDLRKTALFLHSYQDALQRGGRIGPLNSVERGSLAHMICAANLYVLNWTLKDFYTQDVDPQEYLVYQRHSVHIIRWLENERNWHALQKTIATAHE
jgi:homoserine kinase type II